MKAEVEMRGGGEVRGGGERWRQRRRWRRMRDAEAEVEEIDGQRK